MKKPSFATAGCLVLGVIALASTSPTGRAEAGSNPTTCTKLAGKNGDAAEWGSGWIDLEALATFEAGSRLRITIGGSAKRILVRLLKDGQSPDQADGVLGKFDVPNDRVLEVPIAAKKSGITQISVHGSPRAWTYGLGASNGPATVEDVEYCK